MRAKASVTFALFSMRLAAVLCCVLALAWTRPASAGPKYCGDGSKNLGWEQCDTADLDGQSCTGLGFVGGTLSCTGSCTFDTSACTMSVCGNSTIEAGEDCDGTSLNGETCVSQGFFSGTLACSSGCTFDTSGCSIPFCGDSLVAFWEDCDGSNLNGQTCVSQGFASGTLSCQSDCTFDTSACAAANCGNGSVDTGEDCDGSDLNSQNCISLGYTGGTLSCTGGCAFDTSACTSAGTCGDAVVDSGEQCDSGNLNGQSCTSLGFGGGTLTCQSNCTYNLSACTSLCRTYESPDTAFAAGSLVIPMNSGVDQNDMEHASGLAWFLLKHGIRVGWALDMNKSSITDDDFSVSGTGTVASELLRTDATKYSNFSALSGTTHSYAGMPFLIPAEDADTALKLIYQGYLPEDTSIGFGWALPGVSTFDDVTIHRIEVDFTAPTYRMRRRPPTRLALLADDAKNWMDGFLDLAGLKFAGADGTPSSHGYVYDVVTRSDIDGGALDGTDYNVAWIGTYGYTSSDQTAFSKLATFNTNGGAILAMDTGIEALENDHPTQCSCTDTQFMGQTGVVGDGPVGSFNVPQVPANPYLQIGDLSVKGMGGHFKNFLPASTYRDCVTTLLNTQAGNNVITVMDRDGQGRVIYIGGHQYPGGASQKLAIRRVVSNTLFTGGGVAVDVHPVAGELTRSSPLLVEHEGVSSTQTMSFQGSFVAQTTTVNLVFDPSNPSDWEYPAITGKLRAIDLSGFSSSSDPTAFENITSSEIYWEGSSKIPAASSRKIYSATGSSTLARASLAEPNTSVPTAIKTALDVGSTSNADLLLDRIREAGLGGIDLSTPAYIPQSEKITFSNSYERPTVLYIGALDGMMHAFAVKDVESQAWSAGDWSGDSSLQELWAFIPPDQLPRIRFNDGAVQNSPTVADVLGDFLKADGTAGQDSTKEWVTLMTFAGGTAGNSVYAIDVTNPDPGSTECPTGMTQCVKGPNPLWVASPTGMGHAKGTAIGVVSIGTTVTPHVFVASSDASAADGQGGLRVFALDATTGSVTWSQSMAYSLPMASRLTEPNDMPGTVALVDKTGDHGYHTHLYIGDYQGRVWELDAATGAITNNEEIWSATANSATEIDRPIASGTALYRDSTGKLHVAVVTGGIYWAPATSSLRQQVVDINVGLSTPTASVIQTLGEGERVFGSPVISGQDIYVLATEGLADFLLDPSTSLTSGSMHRTNLSTGQLFSLTVGGSASTAGLSSTGKVVLTTSTAVAVRDNTGADGTSSDVDLDESGDVSSKLQLWLANLR